MSESAIIEFLKTKTALGILSEKLLEQLIELFTEVTVQANSSFITEGEQPTGIYILVSGKIDSSSQQKNRELSLLVGSALNLYALLLDCPSQYTVTTLETSKFFYIAQEPLQKFVQQHPEINQTFSQQLALQVQDLTQQLEFEQQRQTILRPYLVSKARRGVIGRSRYAQRLRTQVKEAALDRKSVLIFGEPGLEKDNLAALIHFGSGNRREPIAQVDCSKLQASGADLFGRAGGKLGLLEALGKGTLILNNIHLLDRTLIPAIANLLKTQQYYPVNHKEEIAAKAQTFVGRIIAISEQKFPKLDTLFANTIKVPPLRVRKQDLDEQIKYYINLISRKKCVTQPSITPEALRKLQAYDFPSNLRELESTVERALTQLECCGEITEEIVWQSQSKKKKYRLNLLNKYPQLRQLLKSDWYPDKINYWFTLPFFALIVAVLFLAPQNRQENFALNFFWAWWWPLILIGFPFVGRLWCAFCPFMIYGEVTQKLSLWLFPRQLQKWPKQTADKYGGWFLYGLFALILLWEELWNLENTAYLSAWLLLIITAGAVTCSLIFERRFWCRYLCPIGGMNGMFAKLSMIELRAQQGTCSAECTTYQCYKGGVAKGEGQETNGCPIYSHPAQLEENKDCVLCMTCLKACPHRSVELNLRPPAIELWTSHTARNYEVALLFLLLNVVFVHRLPEITNRWNLTVDLTIFWQHSAIAFSFLFIPIVFPWIAHLVIKFLATTNQQKIKTFSELAYGYLPLVLAANLAHYLNLGLTEGGKILPVTLATFGFTRVDLPIAIAHPAVIAFLQGFALFLGAIWSMYISQKIARKPIKLLLPQHIVIICFAWIVSQIII